eukprot:TRINITY_DN17083_c0_g1_i2.p1 TRINITY_DN17083_c0_g1~~TRINITY_DN17083_c0_g1_i2.p1  ORF type:complete len:317 (+),score=81.64 TRINITY_DN17083_c0_g1_i2:46-951(+)
MAAAAEWRPTDVRWIFDFGKWHPTEAEWQSCLARVQPEERERICKFDRGKGCKGRLNPDAKSSLVGRLMMRKLCTSGLGLDDHLVELRRTEKGKPYLSRESAEVDAAAPPFFNFNASHSGDYVVLGSDSTSLVGVDVMEIALVPARLSADDPADVADFFESMRSYFTVAEWLVIDAGPQPRDQVHAFFCFWTLKEAIIKAMGIGLGYELRDIEFTLKTNPWEWRGEGCLDAAVAIQRVQRTDWRFGVRQLGTHLIATALGPVRDATPTFRLVLSRSSEVLAAAAGSESRPFEHLGIRDLLD